MKIFLSALATETNTFAPFPTGRSAFEEYGVRRGRDMLAGQDPASQALKRIAELALRDGHSVEHGIGATAQPSGPTVRAVYEEYRDEILKGIEAALPLDAVILLLHGAMVAEGYDDCEGDLLGRVRALVGRDCVVGAELDPHCHLSSMMVEQSDLLILMKEYPHTDFVERAEELYELCVRTRRGDIRPTSSVFDCRMIGIYPTAEAPMADLVAELRQAERAPGILSVSFAHGFPWADVADVGSKMLVYADGDEGLARQTSSELGRLIYRERRALQKVYPTIDEALDAAERMDGLVVLADTADNPGGGAPGDDTRLLAAMLERGLTSAAAGCYWDPVVADICADAGRGAELTVRLGGKCGPASGQPLDLKVRVEAVAANHKQTWFGSATQDLGLSVWLRTSGIDLVVCSIRTQVFSPDAFTGLGIELAERRWVAVKSSNHFYAAFRPIAAHVIHVGTPGALNANLAALPYTKRDDNFFPRVGDPLALDV